MADFTTVLTTALESITINCRPGRVMEEAVSTANFFTEIVDNPNDIGHFAAWADTSIDSGDEVGQFISGCIEYQSLTPQKKRAMTRLVKQIAARIGADKIGGIHHNTSSAAGRMHDEVDSWPNARVIVRMRDGSSYAYAQSRDTDYWPGDAQPPARIANHPNRDEPYVYNGPDGRGSRLGRDISIWPKEVIDAAILGIFMKYHAKLVPQNVRNALSNLHAYN